MRLTRVLDKKPRSFNLISLKAKLIIAILTITLGCALVTGLLALKNGQQAHNLRINSQLSTLRDTQKNAIEHWLGTLEHEVAATANNNFIAKALAEFNAAYQKLDHEAVDEKTLSKLSQYYQELLKKTFPNNENETNEKHYLPNNSSARLLQYDYMSPTSENKASEIIFANSQRYYDGVHAYYHPSLSQIIERLDFSDLLLVDLESSAIVYSVKKRIDFATQIVGSQYQATPLGETFAKIKQKQQPGEIYLSDFDFYLPNDNQPTAFMGTTLFNEQHRAIGALILAIDGNKLDKVLAAQKAITSGLGDTTETLLVAQDHLLRSNLEFIDDQTDEKQDKPDCYALNLSKQQLAETTANEICRMQSATLLQSIDNEAVDQALNKQSGIGNFLNYMGDEVIIAYAPLQYGNATWAITTQARASEAYQPILSFQRNLFVSLILIICAVTFLSMLIAHLFVKPISKLTQAAKKLSTGDTAIDLQAEQLDEYGELGRALQQIADNTLEQQASEQASQQEIQSLLANTLPARVIPYYQGPETDYSEQIKDATVLYMVLHTPDDNQNKENLLLDDRFQLSNKIISRLYHVMSQSGADYFTIVGAQLIAGFGFKRSRLDYATRCVQCATQLHSEIQHFNQQQETLFSHQTGIHSSSLMAGVFHFDKERFAYDLLGPALDGARALAVAAANNEILLTDSSYQQLTDKQDFIEKQLPTNTGKRLSIWTYQLAAQPRSPEPSDQATA